jgi:hypothetical protein
MLRATTAEVGVTSDEAVMSELPPDPDLDEARASGSAFGKAIGRRTAEDMTRAGAIPDQLPAIGAEGVAAIIARADTLASAGLDREIVAAWMEGAADAFHSELDAAASLLKAVLPAGAKH